MKTVLNCSQDNLYYIYDGTNLSVYELQLSNYDTKKVTGFTFKYRGVSFFLYNHFDTNTTARCKHYVIRLRSK